MELIKIKWSELQVGDVFPDSGAVVTELWPWVETSCYELETTIREIINDEPVLIHESVIASACHLFSVDTDKAFDYPLTIESKKQTNKESINWIACKDAYHHFYDGKEIVTVPGSLGEIRIRPYKNLEKVRARCISTTKASFQISNVLFGQSSRGTHSLDSMKEIVTNLIESGMSEDWIARNLYLEKSAITRMKQLNSLQAAFRDSSKFSTDVWDPIKDRVEERKNKAELYRYARAYVRKWRSLVRGDGLNLDVPVTLDLLAAAQNLGFDPKNPMIIPKTVNEAGEVIESGIAQTIEEIDMSPHES